MTARSLAVATGNAGKLAEYRDLLAPAGLELIGAPTGTPEDQSTYAANAAEKASAALAATGLASLGDDSGVEVETLDGFPGLQSARLAPTQEERTRLLLERLSGKPRPWRARFRCAVALALPGGALHFFEGVATGEIVPEWRGTAGFGYDPVFVVDGTGKTFGEMAPAEKHAVSHRGKAVTQLLASGLLDRL